MLLRKLKQGDSVEIAAPSSFVDNEKAFISGIQIIEKWGLKINQNQILSRKFNS